MTPKNSEERLFPKEYALELLRIAFGDLSSAKVLSRTESEGRKENIVYMCEQSVEKSIKAVLCSVGLAVPFVHDVGLLLGRVPANLPPIPFGLKLIELSPYASVRRYEEGRFELSSEDINTSLEMAVKVLSWAESIVKNKNDKNLKE